MLDTLIKYIISRTKLKIYMLFFLTKNNNDREQDCLIMVMVIFILIVMSFIHSLILGKLK